MAHYVMGDIHGEADRFHAMLNLNSPKINQRYLKPKFSQNYPTLLKKFQNQADFA